MGVCGNLTVEPVLFLYMLAIFMQYTVFQELVYEMVCANKFNESVCKELHHVKYKDQLISVLDESSLWFMWSGVAIAIPSIISTNFLGSIGDSYGRKVPLFLPSIGMSLGTLIYVVVSILKCRSLTWIIVGSAVSGVTGGFVGCIMAVTCYTAEMSSHVTRTSKVSLLEASTFLAAAIGPTLGAKISNAASLDVVFSICILLNVVLVMYVLSCVQSTERATPDTSVVVTWRELFGVHHLVGALKTTFKNRECSKRTNIMCLLVCAMVIMTATEGEMSQTFVYVHEDPLGWDLSTFGIYSSLRNGLACLPLLFVGWLRPQGNERPCLRLPLPDDHIICSIGLVSKIAGLILLGLSTSTLAVFLVPVLSLLSCLCIPSIRSLLSKQVDADELGKVFAFLAMLQNLCTLLGFLLFNGLFPLTRQIFLGMLFEIGAVILILPLAIMLSPRWKTSSVNYLNVQDPEEDDH